MHGADDVTTLHLKSQVNSPIICGPQVEVTFTAEGWSGQPYFVIFDSNMDCLQPLQSWLPSTRQIIPMFTSYSKDKKFDLTKFNRIRLATPAFCCK